MSIISTMSRRDVLRIKLLSILIFSSRRRHTIYIGDWSSDVCSSDLRRPGASHEPGGRAFPGRTARAGLSVRTHRPGRRPGRSGTHGRVDPRPAGTRGRQDSYERAGVARLGEEARRLDQAGRLCATDVPRRWFRKRRYAETPEPVVGEIRHLLDYVLIAVRVRVSDRHPADPGSKSRRIRGR